LRLKSFKMNLWKVFQKFPADCYLGFSLGAVL